MPKRVGDTSIDALKEYFDVGAKFTKAIDLVRKDIDKVTSKSLKIQLIPKHPLFF